jgi:hypothetical protein
MPQNWMFFSKNITSHFPVISYNKFNLKEGMVLKGVINNRVFMMKVKTWDWLNRVKELYGEKKMLEY